MVLWPVLPQALALRSPQELAEANARLEEVNGALQDKVAELNAANAELARSEALKARLLENLAHELRTPLTLLLGPAETLLSGSHGLAPVGWRPLLRTIRSNAQRLDELIENAIQLTRLDVGAARLQPERVDVGALLFELAQGYAAASGGERASIEVEASTLPPWLEVDRYCLERILFNLLSNAVKFSPPVASVRCAARWSEGMLKLAVSDAGPGIPEELRAVVFERFRQGDDSRSRPVDGLGLGLALVAETTALMGGRAVIGDSEMGGAKVTICVPAARLPGRQSDLLVRRPVSFDDTPEEALPALPDASSLPRVVLAEDNDDMVG